SRRATACGTTRRADGYGPPARRRSRPPWRADSAGPVHEGLEALDVGLDEGAIEAAAPLELRREGPGEDDVGARPEGQVQIGVLGELYALGIHHHDPGRLPATPP